MCAGKSSQGSSPVVKQFEASLSEKSLEQLRIPDFELQSKRTAKFDQYADADSDCELTPLKEREGIIYKQEPG